MNNELRQCIELGNYFEFMPSSDGKNNQSELPKLFLKHLIKESVTFFSGSFNPFHQGHRICLDLCPEKNILIVPDRNPFKANSLQKENPYHEFVMLAESLRDTHFSLYPGFLGKQDPNPTSSWLPKVRMAEKNFLMGDDSFMSLLTWKNPEMIIRALTKLYVVPRCYSLNDYAKQEFELLKWNKNLQIYYLGDHPYKNLSSSELRKMDT